MKTSANRVLLTFKVTKIIGPLLGVMLLQAMPALPAPGDAERDLKGFNQQVLRREIAERALRKGKSYLEDGSYELARKSLSEALTFDENLHEARFCLGLTEYRDGKFKLSVAQLNELYQRYPDYHHIMNPSRLQNRLRIGLYRAVV